MKHLKDILTEGVLGDIEGNLAAGDDFVKGLDIEIANIQKEYYTNKKIGLRNPDSISLLRHDYI